MKKLTYCLNLLTLIFIVSNVISQTECRVLVTDLEGTYTGKCKNGLAHGKGKAEGKDTYEGQFTKGLPDGEGTYIWANGAKYEGDWILGKREGEGVYQFVFNDKDSVQAGLWKADEYMGPVPPPPAVVRNSGVDRYTFLKYGYIKNRVLIHFYQNGSVNTGITNLSMHSTSGADTRLGSAVGYDYITFPVTIKLNYTTYNKLRSVQYSVVFEFIISEPGEWEVDVFN